MKLDREKPSADISRSHWIHWRIVRVAQSGRVRPLPLDASVYRWFKDGSLECGHARGDRDRGKYPFSI